MSAASTKGKGFEQLVAKMIRSKLHAKVMRDRRSGAGVNKSDMSDYFRDLPLNIECKDQKTVKIKEWFRQADEATSFNRVPTVVFHAESEILATLRLSDLLNFLVEIADQKAEIDDLRRPMIIKGASIQPEIIMGQKDTLNINEGEVIIGKEADKKLEDDGVLYLCQNNHVADEYGYCSQKDCKYSRGYRKPKAKRKR